VTLNATAATFSTSSANTLPGQFLTPADFVVGQNVLIDASAFTAAAPPTLAIATADFVELLPTQIAGNADNLASPNFTIDGLNSFYMGNGVTSINAQTGSFTTYNGTLTAFSGLTASSPYFYDGYLLNNPTTPGVPVYYDTNIYGATATADAMKAIK
jgi:hypothetical protein